MRCLGRTKFSNFRKRCTRETSFLLCWQHSWQPFSIVAAIIVFLAAISEFSGYNLRDLFSESKAPVKPAITCTLEYPIKAEGDKVFRNKRNPDVVISNNGPVKVVSISGSVKAYRYDSAKEEITAIVYQGIKSFNHTFSRKELEPFDELRHSTIGLSGENVLAIYVVGIVYYVGPELRSFNLESYFFVENQQIKDRHDFENDDRYDQIMQKLKGFEIPEENGLVVKATCAAEHTWLLEPKNWFSAKRGDNGKVKIIGLPKDQAYTKRGGSAFLEIKPHPFKATGFFTKAEIVDDHVEVKTVFAITNTGDAAAIITDDGFEVVTSIEPGKTKYRTIKMKVFRRGRNQEPLENFIGLINSEEKVFELQFNINYRPADDKEKLLKATGHYNIGKYKVFKITGESIGGQTGTCVDK